jgi:hypothetical protein
MDLWVMSRLFGCQSVVQVEATQIAVRWRGWPSGRRQRTQSSSVVSIPQTRKFDLLRKIPYATDW